MEMGLTFFDNNLQALNLTNVIAPLAIIRTDSTSDIPQCELTLTEEYNNVARVGYFFALSDKKQIYQITNIDITNNSSQIQYNATGQEVGALICSRRLALEDVTPSETINIQEFIQQQLNAFPAITFDNFYFLISSPEGFYYTPHKIFKKNTSLLDYIFEEANIDKAFIKFESEISKELNNKTDCVYLRVRFEKTTKRTPIFANSVYINQIQQTKKTPSYNAFICNTSLTPTTITYQFNTLCLPSYNESNKTSINFITEEKPLNPQAFSLSSFYTLAGFSVVDNVLTSSPLVADSEEVEGDIVRLYVKPTCNIKIRYGITEQESVTVPALIVPICSKDALNYLVKSACYNTHVNELFETSKNGNKNGYQALYYYNESIKAWELLEDAKNVQKKTKYKNAYYYLSAIACIDNIIEEGIKRVRPVSVDAFCVAENSITNDPRYNIAYCKPLNVVAFEQRLISEMPNDLYQTVDVSLSNKYDAKTGDELTIITNANRFRGVVTAVTETWENGEDVKRDIEVNEWKQYN